MPSTLHRSLPRPLPLLPPPLSLAQDRQERLLQELLEIKRKKREAKAQLVLFFCVIFIFFLFSLFFLPSAPLSAPFYTICNRCLCVLHACCPTLWPSPSRSHTQSLACSTHTKHAARAHTLLPLLPLSLCTLSRYVLFVVFYSLSFTHTHTHTHTHTRTTHKYTQGKKELDAEKA